jgi:hypothetical protein
MAFATFNMNLCRLGPQNDNAPTLWSYKSTDAIAAGAGGVDASGYFSAAADRLKVGDLIYAYKTDSTVAAAFFVVLSNTRDLSASPPVSGVVDTANLSVLNTAIDSD